MRQLLLVLVLAFSSNITYAEDEECPARCTCGKLHMKPYGDVLKVRCGGGDRKVTSVQELGLENLLMEIVQLDLSGNNIQTLRQESFLYFPVLQKLNLSDNNITRIEDEAFVNLTSLKRLDLSGNKLSSVTHLMFIGLDHLKKLSLSHNLLLTANKEAFAVLSALRQLDLSDNPLVCDCRLAWLLDSCKKLSPRPRCAAPTRMRGRLLCKALHCEGQRLQLQPANNQVVFAGDTLRLSCRAPTGARVAWRRNGGKVGEQVEEGYISEVDLLESSVMLNPLRKEHGGNWDCYLVSEHHNTSQAVTIIVITNDTHYCMQNKTSSNKGVYTWPETVAGYTAELPCVGDTAGMRHLARHSCSADATWGMLDTSTCPYLSETTKILEQFARVNLSLSKGSLLESARRLHNFTGHGEHLQDPMDVVFVARTVENYLVHLSVDMKEICLVLLDIVSIVMELPSSTLATAQKLDGSCARLLRVIKMLAEQMPLLQMHKRNLAVESFRLSVNATFDPGLTCAWYSNGPSPRLFHCATTTMTSRLTHKVVDALLQVPPALLYSWGNTSGTNQLVVAMFGSDALFPQAHDGVMGPASVIGATIANIPSGHNMTQPLYIAIRSAPAAPRPVVWDEQSRLWVPAACQPSHPLLGDLLVFRCLQLGYFALLPPADVADTQCCTPRADSRPAPPAVFVGSLLGGVFLLCAVLSYVAGGMLVQVSARARHSLINTWVAVLLLSLVFSLGVFQTEDAGPCQAVGVALHYLSLSSLLWMCVSLAGLQKSVDHRDHGIAGEEEEGGELPVGGRPLVGLYLVGWGVGALVCGVAGAVSLTDYAQPTLCFLASGPATGACLVPGTLLCCYALYCALAVRCAWPPKPLPQPSEGTQATDLDSDMPPAPPSSSERLPPSAASTALTEDAEHSPLLQLKAYLAVLALFIMTWGSGAAAVAHPLDLMYEETLFSLLYAALFTMLGAFVLLFHCASRADVRLLWQRWFLRHRGRCCRTRSISDTNPPPPTSCSASFKSQVLTVELNGCISVPVIAAAEEEKPCADHPSAKMAAAMSLVTMHRQQYHHPDGTGNDAAELFYNPHQSTVARKFFRKQRRRQRTGGGLGTRHAGDGGAESAVFLSSDMEVSSVREGAPLERLVIGAEQDEPMPPLGDLTEEGCEDRSCVPTVDSDSAASRLHAESSPRFRCSPRVVRTLHRRETELAPGGHKLSLQCDDEQAAFSKKETSV